MDNPIVGPGALMMVVSLWFDTLREGVMERHRGWYSRGYLPHCDAPGILQAITYRLADSLPKEARDRIKRDVRNFPEARRSQEWRNRIDQILDAGYGSSLLKHPECASIVAEAFRFFDGKRYDLIAWVIMPNHVHLVIRQYDGWPLGGLLRSWKGFTTKKIKEALADTPFLLQDVWQRGYWDRRIRDERHFAAALRYMAYNPVKAGLVITPEEWPWLALPEKADHP